MSYFDAPTYGGLKTDVATWANRSDQTANIPMCIRMAHDVITGQVTIGADLVLSSSTVAQPTDFRRLVSLWVDRAPKRALVLSDENGMANLGSGVPGYYRIDGSDFIIAPSPDKTYPGKALYKIATAQLSADADTNVIMTKYPTVYLLGAQKFMAVLLYDGEAAAGFSQLFDAEIERINRVERGDVMDGPLQTSPSSSYGVTP